MGELENQIAVVTGAAQGLGLAIAKRLASDGARLAMLDSQPGPLQAAAKTLGEAAQAFEVDVTSQENVERVIAQVAETFREDRYPREQRGCHRQDQYQEPRSRG